METGKKKVEIILTDESESSCNQEIHEELKNMNETVCYFCDRQLFEVINDDGKNVCFSCGSFHGYDIGKEHRDFYESIFRIRKKVSLP